LFHSAPAVQRRALTTQFWSTSTLTVCITTAATILHTALPPFCCCALHAQHLFLLARRAGGGARLPAVLGLVLPRLVPTPFWPSPTRLHAGLVRLRPDILHSAHSTTFIYDSGCLLARYSSVAAYLIPVYLVVPQPVVTFVTLDSFALLTILRCSFLLVDYSVGQPARVPFAHRTFLAPTAYCQFEPKTFWLRIVVDTPGV